MPRWLRRFRHVSRIRRSPSLALLDAVKGIDWSDIADAMAVYETAFRIEDGPAILAWYEAREAAT
jgi:hypothetical protein